MATSANDSEAVMEAEKQRRMNEAFVHAYTHATSGAVAVAAALAVGHVLGSRFAPAYAGINFRLKVLLATSITAATFWIRLELAHLESANKVNDAAAEHMALIDAQRRSDIVELQKRRAAQQQQQQQQQELSHSGARYEQLK